MREDTLERIRKSTYGLPERWREVLAKALLKGEFHNESSRLLSSAVAVHSDPPGEMEIAESILAGDAFIPMAVEVLLEEGASLEEIRRVLSETAAGLPG